jgi:hypothetical protein
VQHVLGRERHLDRPSERNVQLIDLAVAIDVLEAPHPALAGRIHLQRLIGRSNGVEVDRRRPDEDPHGDDERDERPADLERNRSSNRVADFQSGVVAILDREERHQDDDEQREKGGHRHDEEVQVVHLGCDGGRLRRKEGDARKHRP